MDELILLLLVVALNGVFDAIVVAWLAGKRSKAAIIETLRHPDEETKEAIRTVLTTGWNWFLTPAKTGKKIVVEGADGEPSREEDELLAPFQYLAKELARFATHQLSSMRGGAGKKSVEIERQLMAELQNPGNPVAAAFQAIAPELMRRAAKDGNLLMLALGTPMGQALLDKIISKVNVKSSTVSVGHGGGSVW